MTDSSPSSLRLPLLRVAAGPSAGRAYPIRGSRATIGRAGGAADIEIDDGKASKLHARFAEADGGWQIEDLGSRNGTALNGARLAAAAALTPGDRVRIGLTEFEFAFAARDGLRLRVTGGVELPLVGARLVLGRAGGDADIALSDDKASKRHARLDHDDGGWTISDLSSRNGTWLNDERLEAERLARLKPGDVVRIGTTEMTVVGGEPPAAAAPAKTASRGPTRGIGEPTPLASRVESTVREPGRESTATRIAVREPRAEPVDARAIAREIGLPSLAVKGILVLVVVVLIIVFAVPALDRAMNPPSPPADGEVRIAPKPMSAVDRVVAGQPAQAPVQPIRTIAPPPVARVIEPEPEPEPEATTAPAPASALPDAAPPTADASAPVLMPRLVAATYIGGPGDQRISHLEITAKGTIVARGDGVIAVYERGCVGGTISAGTAPPAEDAGEAFSLHRDGVAWRFASVGDQPAVTVGARAWWPGAAPHADAARPLVAWALPDGLVGCAFACAGPDTLAARDPRDAARPNAALARGWTATTAGEATLYLVADATGAPRAATWVTGAPAAHAVDESGRLYLARRVGDATDTIGLAGRAGVTVLSADLRRVALALDAGALGDGEAGDETFTALAVRDGVLALAGHTAGKRLPTTANALQAKAQDGLEGFLIVIRLW